MTQRIYKDLEDSFIERVQEIATERVGSEGYKEKSAQMVAEFCVDEFQNHMVSMIANAMKTRVNLEMKKIVAKNKKSVEAAVSLVCNDLFAALSKIDD